MNKDVSIERYLALTPTGRNKPSFTFKTQTSSNHKGSGAIKAIHLGTNLKPVTTDNIQNTQIVIPKLKINFDKKYLTEKKDLKVKVEKSVRESKVDKNSKEILQPDKRKKISVTKID